MARIAGIDLPKNKALGVALTYIYGIGRTSARKIAEEVGLDFTMNTDDITEKDVARIREVIDGAYKVEGDLRREVTMNVKRLMDLGCYRGLRHRRSLPVHGQRTHTNARTRKGPRKQQIGRRK